MAENKLSGLRHYSLGIIVEDKAEGTDYVKICPIEELPLVNGLLKDAVMDYKVDLPDSQGIARNSTLTGDSAIVAKWLPFSEGNRMTAPDVCEGETVIIWRYADTQEFCWSTIFREPSIRRQETVCFALSNLKERMVAFDKDSSYWSEWSTKHKYVKIHTSNNDGELTTYDLVIDTSAGVLSIEDGHGNSVTMDSSSDTITVAAVNKIHVVGGLDVSIASGGPAKVTSVGPMTVSSSASVNVVGSSAASITGGGSKISMSAAGIQLEGGGVAVNISPSGGITLSSESNVTVNASNITLNGQVSTPTPISIG